MNRLVLVINPGASSTKVGLFEDRLGGGLQERLRETLWHDPKDSGLAQTQTEQLMLRRDAVLAFLALKQIPLADLHAIAARGGLLPPLQGGTYRIDAGMVAWLLERPRAQHASNLGAPIAFELAERVGVPAFVTDPVSVDELSELSRVSGLAGVERESLFHALNIRATARRHAAETGRHLDDLRLVVAHLGSGTSLAALEAGRAVDVVNPRDEGPFGADRCGSLPIAPLLDWLEKSGMSLDQARSHLFSQGGLLSLLGTRDLEEVERRILAGDSKARLVFDAMALQIAKAIAQMAVSLSGQVDAILITGGMARSNRLVDAIHARVEFIAPLHVHPGEDELLALAEAAFRVLDGVEEAPCLRFE